MEQVAQTDVSRRKSFGRTIFQFLLHLAVVYLLAQFAVMWLAAQVHNVILPLLRLPSSEGRFEFAFNHLLLFSLLCGLFSGVIAATENHRPAHFVWIVPAIVLVYKFTTYPASVFENHTAVAFHHYLGGGFLIPEFHSYQEMFAGWNSDYARGLDQTRFTAPLYVSIAYACASLVGARLGIRLPGFGTPIPSKENGAGCG